MSSTEHPPNGKLLSWEMGIRGLKVISIPIQVCFSFLSILVPNNYIINSHFHWESHSHWEFHSREHI